MDEPNKEPDAKQAPAESAVKSESHSPLEPVYQHFQDVPLKYVDIFIGLCVAALVLAVVAGILKGNGII